MNNRLSILILLSALAFLAPMQALALSADNGDLFSIAQGMVTSIHYVNVNGKGNQEDCNCKKERAEILSDIKVQMTCTIQSLKNTLAPMIKYQVGNRLTLSFNYSRANGKLSTITLDHLRRDYLNDFSNEPMPAHDLEPSNLDRTSFDRYDALYGMRTLEMTKQDEDSMSFHYREGEIKDHLISNGIDPEQVVDTQLYCQLKK